MIPTVARPLRGLRLSRDWRVANVQGVNNTDGVLKGPRVGSVGRLMRLFKPTIDTLRTADRHASAKLFPF
jgi:hypothetical protein